jgi:hypothetical protein
VKVKRSDLGALKPAKRRADGTMVVDAHITRCGVFEYLQPDGTIQRELRLPEDVFKKDSLDSLSKVPVTDDHPPDMIDAQNARQFMRGASGDALRDGDHVRSELAIYDSSLIARMEKGKQEVSCGYECDLERKAGDHPDYGKFDCIQRNIVGNHVAIVDAARAGHTARVRMDSAFAKEFGRMVKRDSATGTSAVSVTSGDDPDAGDLAHRSAAGENSATSPDIDTLNPPRDVNQLDAGDRQKMMAKACDNCDAKAGQPCFPKKDESVGVIHASRRDKFKKGDGKAAKPVANDDDPGDDEIVQRGPDGTGNGADDDPDADPGDDRKDYEKGQRDGDDLTEGDRKKMASESFADPERMGLPINNPGHVKAAMARFGQYEKFPDANAKHAAYNRILRRAKQFGIDPAGFQKQWENKLDSIERKDESNMSHLQELTRALEDARREKARADAAETRAATAEGELASAKKQVEQLQAAHTDSSTKLPEMVRARVALVAAASAVLPRKDGKTIGADGKALDLYALSEREVKVAVVKHVDREDVAADKHDAFVDAWYEGAIKRAATSAAALGGARPALVHGDAADDSDGLDPDEVGDSPGLFEEERKAREKMRNDSRNAWQGNFGVTRAG